MTNRNSSWSPDGDLRTDMERQPRQEQQPRPGSDPEPVYQPKPGNVPFLLSPAGKDYLWGGSRLNDDFSKNIPLEPLAETWECSTHPDGPSTVASGVFQGRTLLDILHEHPEYLGTHPKSEDGLPILIKLIDTKKDLSVQVHPDDKYAKAFENGALGKTEMWYVLDAAKDAKLIYGFYHDMDEATLRKSLADGTAEKYLRKVPIQKDDVFFIPAGQVHAIGAGALIAEIQESSNLTYRLYDYNRLDKDGKPRELHVEKALRVANLRKSTEPRQPMRVLRFHPGVAVELLCRCKYFEVSRVLLNTERVREMACMQAGGNSFQVLLCTEGCGVFFWEKESLPFYKGDCLFIPADSVPIRIHGKAQLLKVSC
ncbi:MAG: class I mannose-6-phosphate isomerase [Lachnospiraceae bacterium]|nr:class I mannose-6-phosphate isomerase [Lachnospiraceae bacterium]